MAGTRKTRKSNGRFVPKPRTSSTAHKKVMAELKTMSKAELLQSLVKAGVCTKAGRMPKGYRDAFGNMPAFTVKLASKDG